jgi:hypothetical protein
MPTPTAQKRETKLVSVITNADALSDMRSLEATSTGRLRGMPARWTSGEQLDRLLRDTPQPWRARVTADLTDRYAGILTAGSAEYLVWSDNVLIAVLTVAARVELPDYPLSALQRRHQTAVVAVLSDLPRRTLVDLADRRAGMDGRDEQAAYETNPPNPQAIRVAPADDPTVTEWVTTGGDLADAHACVRAVGLDPQRSLILSAPGYGAYGRDRHRLDLPTLCAMNHLAIEHEVSTAVVGDWLDAEGVTRVELGPEQITAAFRSCYLGSYPSTYAYTHHRMAELGWKEALAQAGIPAEFLDLSKIEARWFTTEVRAIKARQGIAVFSRATRQG